MGEAGSPLCANSAVIFDLDGTLVEPFEGIANSYRHMCDQMGLPQISDQEIRTMIGPPIQEALSHRFSLKGRMLQDAIEAYRDWYAHHGLHELAPHEGAEGLLSDLKDGGICLCVATSKPQLYAEQILENLGWRQYFAEVVGASLDGTLRLKVDIIKAVMRRFAAPGVSCVMVGDRPEDALGAREVGIPFVGVDWGYGSSIDLVELGAVTVVHSNSQLIGVLQKVL